MRSLQWSMQHNILVLLLLQSSLCILSHQVSIHHIGLIIANIELLYRLLSVYHLPWYICQRLLIFHFLVLFDNLSQLIFGGQTLSCWISIMSTLFPQGLNLLLRDRLLNSWIEGCWFVCCYYCGIAPWVLQACSIWALYGLLLGRLFRLLLLFLGHAFLFLKIETVFH